MKINRKNNLTQYQAGVGLIDVMVAVFILSVGLLAISALQLISKQSNFEAIQRSHASALAYDLFERMRSNSGTALSTTNPLTYYVNSGTVIFNHNTPVTLTPPVDCKTAYCDPQNLAAWDLIEWQRSVRGELETRGGNNVGGLFEPTACLSGPSPGPSGNYRLTITWRGQAKIKDQQPGNTCGTSLYGAANEYRRILVLDSYLGPSQI